MTQEQAARRAAKLRSMKKIGPIPSDEEDWLWQYDNGFIITD